MTIVWPCHGVTSACLWEGLGRLLAFHSLCQGHSGGGVCLLSSPPLSCPCPCPCPCPEAWLRSSSGAFGFILYTQVHRVLPPEALLWPWCWSLGKCTASRPILSAAACYMFGRYVVCQWRFSRQVPRSAFPHSSLAAVIPEPTSFIQSCVWVMRRWDGSHFTASSLISLPSPAFNVPLLPLALGP